MSDRGPIRVLFASEFWPGATARSLLSALVSRGWQVRQLDVQDHLPNVPSLAGRIVARLLRKQRTIAFNRAIVAAAKDFNATVFLVVKGTHISPATIRALQATGVLCVNFYPDIHFNDVAIDTVALYDLIATTKSFQLHPLRALAGPERVEFIHHGYSDEFHRIAAGPRPECDVDVLYVGNAGTAKVAQMAALAEALPGVSMRVVGAGWSKAARDTAFERIDILPVRSGAAYAAEIARAKIVLGFHSGPDRVTGVEDLVSTRTFEIPACGGFMLHVDNDEVRSLYSVPDEIETFTDADNCAAKIRYWLAHPEEREAVAARGHARAVPAYGYAARGRELALMIEQRLKN